MKKKMSEHEADMKADKILGVTQKENKIKKRLMAGKKQKRKFSYSHVGSSRVILWQN